MTNDARSREIISNIKSKDIEFVLETIGKIRESGNSAIMDALIDLLHNTKYPEIKESILKLLSELKNKDSVPILIAAIKDEKYSNECKDLVTCCWQNGLIYNEYLPLFVDLVIKEEFLTAFEAFTVIENMYGNIDDEIIEQEILKINGALKSAGEQKEYLLNNLLKILKDIPQEQEFNN
jgi:hypothetical protein